jgi:hypothetical protein
MTAFVCNTKIRFEGHTQEQAIVHKHCTGNSSSCVQKSKLTGSLTCQTPTQALAMRMSKITKGSTKAVIESSSSKKASTYK